MRLRIYSLNGNSVAVVAIVDVETVSQATQIVEQHLKETGYTNLHTVDDVECVRFVADPPKGRKGRNVAALDY